MSSDLPGNRRLGRSAPEEQGVSSSGLSAFVAALAGNPELHSVMVLRHGTVIAEGWSAPFTPSRVHEVYSVSKSVTSTAVGFARAEGLLDLDDLVLDHFPERAPAEPEEHLRRMRLRHLLTMTAGHDVEHDIFPGKDWVRDFLALPVPHEPGTHFQYNTPGSYVLSAVVQKVTGQRLLDYLGPRLFAPLGIVGARWEQCPMGVDTGGFGLSVTTEDLACLGQLYLQDGVWDGRQVLPEGWVDEASRAQVPTGSEPRNEWGQGYGYQFWRNVHDGYRADGAFGQFIVVMPTLDTVVALTAAVSDSAVTLDIVRDLLVPAVRDDVLPPDPSAHAALTAQLAGLRLDPPAGAVVTACADRLRSRTILVDPNPAGVETVVVEPGPVSDRLTVQLGGVAVVVEAGHREEIATRMPGLTRSRTEEDVLVSGTWTGPDVYTLTARFVESPHVATIVVTVAGDDVLLEPSLNVSFGPTQLPALVGRLVT